MRNAVVLPSSRTGRRYAARSLLSHSLFLFFAMPFLQITDTLEYTLVDINTRT